MLSVSWMSLPLGILEVLYCVLIESPEVLNIIQENHIKSIISLLDKHGRNHKVGVSSELLLLIKVQPMKPLGGSVHESFSSDP